jgi:hypothetical protein
MKHDISIVAIDTAYHKLTGKAIELAVQTTGIHNIVVISDQQIYPGARHIPIDLITKSQFNEMSFNGLHDIVETDFVMFVQHDGMPTNMEYWHDSYLEHDYIGAPWPWLPEGKNVGNSGFSIRSRRLIQACADLAFSPPDLIEPQADDVLICRHYRSLLEEQGLTWAPSMLAQRFSTEIPRKDSKTFGFHGEACLPYYLDDDHMEFYLLNMPPKMWQDMYRIGSMFLGLHRTERWDHLGLLVEQGNIIDTNFKQNLIDSAGIGSHNLSDLTKQQLQDLLINY